MKQNPLFLVCFIDSSVHLCNLLALLLKHAPFRGFSPRYHYAIFLFQENLLKSVIMVWY